MRIFFKKFTAAILIFATLFTITATVDGTDDLSTTEPTLPTETSLVPKTHTTPNIRAQIDKLISIAPKNFCVDPDFLDYEKANPYITCQIIEQIIKIFTMYPLLTQKFIEQLQYTDDKKFELKLFSGENIELDIAPLLPNLTNVTSIYYANKEKIRIFINSKFIDSLNSNPILHKNFKNVIGTEYIDYSQHAITHEMGHLIISLIRFCRDRRIFIKSLNVTQTLYRLTQILQSPEIQNTLNKEYITKCMKEFSEHNDIVKRINEEFKYSIITRAKNELGYTGDGYIDMCGEESAEEWLAETFAHGLCNTSPNPLCISMLKCLDDIEHFLTQ